MTPIKAGIRVTWRSTGGAVPYVWFHGKVLMVPTEGKWLGVALVADDVGTPRHVSIDRLLPSNKLSARSTPLGGATA